MRTLRFALKSGSHRMMYERLQHVAFPANYGKNVFAFSYKEEFAEDGWTVYDAEAELRRLVSVWVECVGVGRCESVRDSV